MKRVNHGFTVCGVEVDGENRCAHYRSRADVVAIRIPGGHEFWACAKCYSEILGQTNPRWRADQLDERAILCGHCGTPHTIRIYLAADGHCPACRGPWNRRCRMHRPLYFDIESDEPQASPDSFEQHGEPLPATDATPARLQNTQND